MNYESILIKAKGRSSIDELNWFYCRYRRLSLWFIIIPKEVAISKILSRKDCKERKDGYAFLSVLVHKFNQNSSGNTKMATGLFSKNPN